MSKRLGTRLVKRTKWLAIKAVRSVIPFVRLLLKLFVVAWAILVSKVYDNKNVLTFCHSSSSNLSVRILSRFELSASSQCSSSIRVSICCRDMSYHNTRVVCQHNILYGLTVRFCSARSSIRYVEDHRTFMLRTSWTGRATPALDWTVFHISFCFDDEHS